MPADNTLSEQALKRNRNREAVLRTLHFHGPMQRSGISRSCGIRKSSITSIIDELLQAGLVCPTIADKPRSPLGLNPQKHYVCAASIDSKEIRFANIYLDGNAGASQSVNIQKDCTPGTILQATARGLKKLLGKSASGCLGIGVSVPGLVDPQTGTGVHAVNLPNWCNIAMKEALEKQIGREIYVDNDIRAALWSGLWFDRLINTYQDVFYIHIGSGIGAAALQHGKPVVGNRFCAGEIGHIRAGDEGRNCVCGKTDCLESYLSIPALSAEISKIRSQPERLMSAAEIAQATKSDPAVKNLLDREASRLAKAIAGIIALLDPPAIVLGNQPEEFCNALAAPLKRHLLNELGGSCAPEEIEFLVSGSGENATLKGIAAMVIDRVFRDGIDSRNH